MIANIPHANNTDEVLSSIEAMRAQEESYQTTNYLSSHYQFSRDDMDTSSCGPQSPVDAECRVKMAEWCYQVVDFCHFSRETVAIAVSYLDRYLMTGPEALFNRKLFQLAAMTCLYTAIKIHEPEAMEPKVVSSLSRGTYTEDQVVAMEAAILSAIGWKMNPPTALAFGHHFLALLPQDAITNDEREMVLDAMKSQTEAAVKDCSMMDVEASTVALAALANALPATSLSDADEAKFLDILGKLSKVEIHSVAFVDTQDKLCQSILPTSPIKRMSSPKTVVTKTIGGENSNNNEDDGVYNSPRSVSR